MFLSNTCIFFIHILAAPLERSADSSKKPKLSTGESRFGSSAGHHLPHRSRVLQPRRSPARDARHQAPRRPRRPAGGGLRCAGVPNCARFARLSPSGSDLEMCLHCLCQRTNQCEKNSHPYESGAFRGALGADARLGERAPCGRGGRHRGAGCHHLQGGRLRRPPREGAAPRTICSAPP